VGPGVTRWTYGTGSGTGASTGRAPGERLFVVITRVFHAGNMLVTTVLWVHVKIVFTCLCYNLLQMGSLEVALYRGLPTSRWRGLRSGDGPSEKRLERGRVVQLSQ